MRIETEIVMRRWFRFHLNIFQFGRRERKTEWIDIWERLFLFRYIIFLQSIQFPPDDTPSTIIPLLLLLLLLFRLSDGRNLSRGFRGGRRNVSIRAPPLPNMGNE